MLWCRVHLDLFRHNNTVCCKVCSFEAAACLQHGGGTPACSVCRCIDCSDTWH